MSASTFNEPLSADVKRSADIAELLFSTDSKLTVDALLDAFKVLYEECSNPSLRTNKNVALFLERYADVVRKVQKLRFSPDDFQSIQVIGRGEFGEVHLVRSRVTSQVYAMKLLNKVEICRQLEKTSYWQERDVMAHNIDSEWIVRLDYAFQDDKYLYLIMEFVPGGDLFSLTSKYECLDEEWARFYIMESVLAVQSLHERNYCHRDIKPDNLMIDMRGHIKLADFGSTAWLGESGQIKSETAVGTPDYVSPEVLASQGGGPAYGKSCDWWQIGIVLYELLYGDPPFAADTLSQLYGRIMQHETALVFPDDVDVSEEAKDLISKLLISADKRIGFEEIKKHPWFAGHSWDAIAQFAVPPPYIPDLKSPTDTRHFEDILEKPVSKECFPTSKGFSGNHLPFVGFTFARAAKWATLIAQGPALPVTDSRSVSNPKTDPVPLPLKSHNGTKQADIAQLEACIEITNAELEAARRVVNDSSTKIMELEELVGRKEKELQTAMRTVERKEKLYRDTLVEIELKSDELRALSSKVNKAEDRAKRAEEREHEYKAQVATLQSQHSEGRVRAMSESDNAKQQLREEIASLRQANTQLNQAILGKQEVVAKMKVEKACLEAERSAVVAAKQRAEEIIAERESTIARLTSQLETVTEELEALKRDYAHEVASLKTDAQDLRDAMAKSNQKIGHLVEENTLLTQKKEEAEREAVVARAEMDKVTHELQSLQQHTEQTSSQTQHEYQKTIQELTSNNARLEMLKTVAETDLESQKLKLVKELKRCETLEDDLTQMEKELKSIKMAHLQSQQEVSALQVRLGDVQEKLKRVEEDRQTHEKEAKRANIQIELLETRNTELVSAKLHSEVELKETQRRLDHAQKQLAKLEQEMAHVQTSVNTLESSDTDKLEMEIAMLKEKVGMLQTRETETRLAYDDELRSARFQIDILQKRVRELDEAGQEHTQEHVRLTAEKNELAELLNQQKMRADALAERLIIETEDKDVYQRAYDFASQRLAKTDSVRSDKMRMREAKPESYVEKQLRRELQVVNQKCQQEAQENMRLQEKLGDAEASNEELRDKLAKLEAEFEDMQRMTTVKSKNHTLAGVIAGSPAAALHSASTLQSFSSTSLSGSVHHLPSATAAHGELKGYVRVPKKEKNLKGDWEKRYLVYEAELQRLFLWAEDPAKKAGDYLLSIPLDAVDHMFKPKPGQDLYQLKREVLGKIFEIMYDPRPRTVARNALKHEDTHMSLSQDALATTTILDNNSRHPLKRYKLGAMRMMVCTGCNKTVLGDYLKCTTANCTILVHPECESKITYGCYQKADRLSKVLIVQFADESTRDMWFDVIYEKYEHIKHSKIAAMALKADKSATNVSDAH